MVCGSWGLLHQLVECGQDKTDKTVHMASQQVFSRRPLNLCICGHVCVLYVALVPLAGQLVYCIVVRSCLQGGVPLGQHP